MARRRKIAFNKERFTEKRNECGLTLRQLCDMADLPFETIKGCVREGRMMPEDLTALCKILGAETEYICGMVHGLDLGYDEYIDRVNEKNSVAITVKTTIKKYLSKKEILALLLEVYDYPDHLIKEAKEAPEKSKLIQYIDSRLVSGKSYDRAEWNYPDYDINSHISKKYWEDQKLSEEYAKKLNQSNNIEDGIVEKH